MPDGTKSTILTQVPVSEWTHTMKCYKILTTAITGMSTPRFPALLDAWWEIKSGQNFTILFHFIVAFICYYGHLHTFKAGPFSEALSLARFPSRPSWTNSSKRFTINSSTSCSPCRFAAIFARAFITAREQCLHATEGALI